jgi:voltage-gated potassium channel
MIALRERSEKRRHLGPRLGVPLGLLTTVIAGGTLGYVVIEGWSAWDAFYMTVTTVATVGYREVNPLSRAGQVFTVILVFGGVGTALYTFSAVATIMVEGGWRQALEQRRYARMIEQLTDHFIVCGFGRIGSIIAEEFRCQKVPFVIVDNQPDRVRLATERGFPAIEADASREEALKQAGVGRARGLVAAVGTDAENVYAILTARGLRPDLFVVGRAESADSVAILQKAGADRVISPYQIGAMQMAQTALRPAVVDFVEFATSSGNVELVMEQVRIHPGSALAGQSLVNSNLRQRFKVVVVGIKRSDGAMEFNPAPEAIMQAGDDLVVLGSGSSLKELEAAARQGAS